MDYGDTQKVLENPESQYTRQHGFCDPAEKDGRIRNYDRDFTESRELKKVFTAEKTPLQLWMR